MPRHPHFDAEGSANEPAPPDADTADVSPPPQMVSLTRGDCACRSTRASSYNGSPAHSSMAATPEAIRSAVAGASWRNGFRLAQKRAEMRLWRSAITRRIIGPAHLICMQAIQRRDQAIAMRFGCIREGDWPDRRQGSCRGWPTATVLCVPRLSQFSCSPNRLLIEPVWR